MTILLCSPSSVDAIVRPFSTQSWAKFSDYGGSAELLEYASNLVISRLPPKYARNLYGFDNILFDTSEMQKNVNGNYIIPLVLQGPWVRKNLFDSSGADVTNLVLNDQEISGNANGLYAFSCKFSDSGPANIPKMLQSLAAEIAAVTFIMRMPEWTTQPTTIANIQQKLEYTTKILDDLKRGVCNITEWDQLRFVDESMFRRPTETRYRLGW